MDWKLAPGTVTGGLKNIEPLFQPIYEALGERNRTSVHHQADETRWLVFVEKEGKVGHRWWLWVLLAKTRSSTYSIRAAATTFPRRTFPKRRRAC